MAPLENVHHFRCLICILCIRFFLYLTQIWVRLAVAIYIADGVIMPTANEHENHVASILIQFVADDIRHWIFECKLAFLQTNIRVFNEISYHIVFFSSLLLHNFGSVHGTGAMAKKKNTAQYVRSEALGSRWLSITLDVCSDMLTVADVCYS